MTHPVPTAYLAEKTDRCGTGDCDLANELRRRWYDTLEHPAAFHPGTGAYDDRRRFERDYRRHRADCRGES